mmetsp:Transcript_4070/g.8872  ORF Transcript_4070/g.8872 Transcript_4070/m.8872 type:complete len:236 (-) Transcript_4070:141-848(-)
MMDDAGVFSNSKGTRRLSVVAVALTPTHSGVIALARSALARKPSASLAQQMVAAATSFPSATATRPTYSAPIPMAAENAAAVGGRTSVSFPPMIHGLEEAAVTDADKSKSSSAVSWGFCPARLSRSCMSSSRFESAAQTCSSRFEVELTWGLRLRRRLPLIDWERLPLGPLPISFCCFLYSLNSALSKTPPLERGFRASPEILSRNCAVRVPSIESPWFVSTEVSVDSDTFEARN